MRDGYEAPPASAEMHDPSDMTAQVLDLNDIERACGVVEGRMIEWGSTTLVMLRHESGCASSGISSRNEGQSYRPDLARDYCRRRALEGLAAFLKRKSQKLKVTA